MSYLKFEEKENPGKKTKILLVTNTSGEHLGAVAWQNNWRQYIFKPAADTVFSKDCLADILEQVKRLNKETYHG